jgi:hypothetical protein
MKVAQQTCAHLVKECPSIEVAHFGIAAIFVTEHEKEGGRISIFCDIKNGGGIVSRANMGLED